MANSDDSNVANEDYPDYSSVDIPDDKEWPEFDTDERRAFLLKRIREEGSYLFLDQRELSHRFELSPSTINKDFKYIARSINCHTDEEELRSNFKNIYQWMMFKAKQDDDVNLSEMRKVVKDFKKFLLEVGEMEEETSEITLDGNVNINISEPDTDD